MMAGVLLWLIAGGWLRDQRLKLYLIAYGGYRFATEYIRPEPVWALGLTFYQWVCLAMIVALAIQWVVDARTNLSQSRQDAKEEADAECKSPA
jgi:prolipoprotein diacylglyceryltransferase